MNAGYRYFVASKAVIWNVPNKVHPEATELFSSTGVRWFLFDRRSAMNIPTLRRLLKRHLSPREFRKTFYPILFRHLTWLSYGWLLRKPFLHRLLRALKGACRDRQQTVLPHIELRLIRHPQRCTIKRSNGG